MKSRWEGILASYFDGFFGSKLGGKMEPKSIQKGVEKTLEKLEGIKMAKKSQQDVLQGKPRPNGANPGPVGRILARWGQSL